MKPRFAELIHEKTDASARGPDHIGQRVLTDLWNDHLRLAFFPEVGSNRSHAPVNRPGNDSVGLQQHAAVFQNTRVSKGYSLGSEKTTCAAARLSACGLRRSTPKSSARMGSSKSGTMQRVVGLY